jgi:hypothetical protein
MGFAVACGMPHVRKRSTNSKLDTGIRPSDLNIPVDEQRRLVKESEILQKISPDEEDDDGTTFAEHVFNAIVLIIPSASLFVMMDLYYGLKPYKL